jgi:stress-induced morphogen
VSFISSQAILRAALAPSRLSVKDVSGGCGSMYALHVESPHFQVRTQHSLRTMQTESKSIFNAY